MCGARSIRAYVLDMVQACERIVVFGAHASDDELLADDSPSRGAVLHQFTVLGEAAKRVPPQVADTVPSIPWADIARFRDKIVHYYHGLDDVVLLDAVRTAIPRDLPILRELAERLEDQMLDASEPRS